MNNCEKCLNTRPIMSENGYHHVCALSARVARNCLLGKKDHFIPAYPFRNGDTIDDIVRRLNDGLNRTEGEFKACKKWLLEFQLANDMTLRELDALCFEDPDFIFDNVFGER